MFATTPSSKLVAQGKANTNEEQLTMRRNPLNKGIIMENAAGVGSVTPAMVEARARELALINGHGSTPNEADWQQPKRELTGEEGINEAEHDQMLRAAEEEEKSDELET